MADDQPTPEQWKPIPGHPGYEASSLGRVRSIDRVVTHKSGFQQRIRGRVLALNPTTHGYLSVYVGVPQPRAVHHLVLETFVGERPNGMVACHHDDNPTNNRVDNLRWDTTSSNTRDMVRNGAHNNARKVECKNGHEFTAENTYMTSRGSRQCRTCRLDYQREWHQKRKSRQAQ